MQNGTEQFVAAQRALLDTAHNVSLKTIEGVSRLFELNVQAARTAIADSTSQVKALFDVDPTRFSQQGVVLPQLSTEKVAAYVKQAYEIVATTNSEIAELLQKHVEDAQELAVEAIDRIAKSAPAGSETFFAAAKNSLGAARNAYEQAVSASKKVTELTEQNVAAVAKAGARVVAKKSADVAAAPSIITEAA